MRIGVNALFLIPGRVGGTEIYLRSLLAALAETDTANEYRVFVNRETETGLVPARPNFRAVQTGISAVIRPARILYEQFLLPFEAGRLDVMLNPGFTAPALASWPQVTVFHDLQHVRHPEHFRWFDLPAWRFLLWLSARGSSRLIAVSESTRADLLHCYRIAPERVTVVPHGVEPTFFELDRSATEPYVLCVSTLHPHKNLDRLVRVFARFRAEHPPLRLVIAGLRGFYSRQLERTIAACAAQDFVELTGWIPRPRLLELFARARAFVYPSTFEGFGMPVLEAMAAGVPVACSSIAPLREVAGESAVFFDPGDDQAMLAALHSVTCDEAVSSRLARGGPERARRFCWRRAAEETLAVVAAAASTRRPPTA